MTTQELLNELGGRADDSDWITTLTPLLVLDIISLSLLLRGINMLTLLSLGGHYGPDDIYGSISLTGSQN